MKAPSTLAFSPPPHTLRPAHCTRQNSTCALNAQTLPGSMCVPTCLVKDHVASIQRSRQRGISQ
eukprot:4640160-Prymnesium_polylepis.1